MRQSLLLLSLFATFATPSFAQQTLNELREKKIELETAELEAKISKAKSDVRGSETKTQTSVTARRERDDMSLNSIFGVGGDLSADISINGVNVEMRSGQSVMGWTVRSIDQYSVELNKGDKKKGTYREVTLRLVGTGAIPSYQRTSLPPPPSFPLPQGSPAVDMQPR